MTDGARVEVVLFDFDHTLVNSPLDFDQMRRVICRLCESFGVYLERPEERLVLELVDEAAAQLDPVPAHRMRHMAEACLRDLERSAAEQAVAVDGVPEALERLALEGRRIGIITRNSREVVLDALKLVPLRHDLLLARDDVERVKPHPDHARAALERFGVGPEAALLCGDFEADIACAQAAGLRAVGVATGASTPIELKMAGALTVLTSAAMLPDWLARQGW